MFLPVSVLYLNRTTWTICHRTIDTYSFICLHSLNIMYMGFIHIVKGNCKWQFFFLRIHNVYPFLIFKRTGFLRYNSHIINSSILKCIIQWLPLLQGSYYFFPVIHMHVSILVQILFPFRLLHNIKQSSLWYTVGPCWLSILNIDTYPSQTP